jgi:hypothetical protein
MLERVFESFYTKSTGLGSRPPNLSFDHRGAWRAALGEHKPAAWRHFSVYASRRCKHSIVIGTQAACGVSGIGENRLLDRNVHAADR